MAALYLHHALFAADPQPPPSSAPTLHDRQSSFSSVNLRTTPDYSHPTEPLLEHEGPFVGSSAYLDILARQPVHPAEPRASWSTSLSLQPEPITPRERKRLREQVIRKKLRQLRWAKRILVTVIASWATYNAIRYFLAFSIHTPGRQATSLALGIVSALSIALLALSVGMHAFLPRFGRSRRLPSIYSEVQTLLEYLSSVSILSPAITNLVLVCVWRRNADLSRAVEGRCTWDIDVVWSGTRLGCEPSKAISWGYWLCGAIVRLAITAAVLFTYHLLSYKYSALTTRSSRKKGGRTHNHSISYPTGSATEPSLSIRSSRTMLSSTTVPVSLARSGRQASHSTSEKQSLGDNGADINSTGRRPLYRASSTRISSEQLSGDDPRDPSRHSQPSSEAHIAGSSAPIDYERASFGSFEEEDPTSEGDNGAYTRYGRPIRHSPGAYLIAPVDEYSGRESDTPPMAASAPANEPHGFVDRFRELLDQVTRETEAGMELAQNDQPGYYTDSVLQSPSIDSEDASDVDYVPIVGSLIQRMPTIESLGSREVMSLASVQRGDRSVHSLSRPPTRANTLSLSEATGSQPPSRSNSLTASVILTTTPTEGQPPANELGCQMSKTPSSQGGSGCVSRNTGASYYATVGSQRK